MPLVGVLVNYLDNCCHPNIGIIFKFSVVTRSFTVISFAKVCFAQCSTSRLALGSAGCSFVVTMPEIAFMPIYIDFEHWCHYISCSPDQTRPDQTSDPGSKGLLVDFRLLHCPPRFICEIFVVSPKLGSDQDGWEQMV